MVKNKTKNLKAFTPPLTGKATRAAFTIVELMLATVIAAIVISGIGIIIVDSQRSWNTMYSRIYADVVTDSYVARKTFDAVVRKAKADSYLLSDTGDWLEVYYYSDPNSTAVDRYARFYQSNSQLKVEYGSLDPAQELSTQTISSNVSYCAFEETGQTARMILTLDDGSQAVTVASSAVMHN